MGGRGAKLSTNNFSQPLTVKEYTTIGTIEKVKVLRHKNKTNASLPEFSIHSDSYISIGNNGKLEHLRIYKDHYPVIEIDLGHSWHHGLTEGSIHVHDYKYDENNMPIRSRFGRKLTVSEMKKYGKIIKKMQLGELKEIEK